MSKDRVLNKGWKGIKTCTAPPPPPSTVVKYWNILYTYKGIYTQTAVSTVGHKGLGDREMQAAPFQQGVSWETISSLLGCRRVWGRGTKTVFPCVGLKGKYYLPTAAIISSSAVMTAGIDQKEKIAPEVSHRNAKQAVTGRGEEREKERDAA